MALTVHAQTPVASGNVTANLGSDASIRLKQFTDEGAAIELDGLLKEQAWAAVPAFNRMRLIEPDTLEKTDLPFRCAAAIHQAWSLYLF